MNPQESILLRSARWLAFGSAAAIMLGIAPAQILLALAFAALLACGEKLRLPRIRLPLALFLLGTVISLLLSDDPAAGLPQIRKFYVFLELLVVFSLLHNWNDGDAAFTISGFAQDFNAQDFAGGAPLQSNHGSLTVALRGIHSVLLKYNGEESFDGLRRELKVSAGAPR